MSDLLRQQIFQLIAYLMSCVKLLRQVVGVVTLADENVLAAPFANLDRQSQDLLPLGSLLLGRDSILASGFRRPGRRALLVLSLLLLLKLLLLLLGHALEIVSLKIIQIARQTQRLKELLLGLHLVLRLVQSWVTLSAPSLISILLHCRGIIAVSTDGHLVTYMASNARIIVRICELDTSLMALAYLVRSNDLVLLVLNLLAIYRITAVFVVWLAE